MKRDNVLQLIESYTQAQSTQLMEEHVERFRNAGCGHWIAFDDSLIGAATSSNIITLDGEDFLQHMASAKCLESPNLHLTKTLASELCFTTKRLLSDE